MTKNKKNIVETDEQRKAREVVETIAINISSLAQAVHNLLNGKLKRKALIILLAQSAQVSQEKVGFILSALENLEKDWLNN